MNARHASAPYDKVAAYQRRGTRHFLALIRMDGPKTDDRFADPPRWQSCAFPIRCAEGGVAPSHDGPGRHPQSGGDVGVVQPLPG